jgi:hypothetical protein
MVCRRGSIGGERVEVGVELALAEMFAVDWRVFFSSSLCSRSSFCSLV